MRDFAQEKQLNIYDACAHIVERKNAFKLSQRAHEGLKEYVHIVSTLREMVKAERPLHEIITEALERSRYLEYLREDPESYEERRGNIEELVTKAAEWQQEVEHPSLAAFLEELTLKSSTDDKETSEDQVRMMPFTTARGLNLQGSS